MRISKRIQEGAWLSRIKGYFNVRLAIIEVRPGETREESWKRHLADHPEAEYTNIKIFNQAKSDRGALSRVGLLADAKQF